MPMPLLHYDVWQPSVSRWCVQWVTLRLGHLLWPCKERGARRSTSRAVLSVGFVKITTSLWIHGRSDA